MKLLLKYGASVNAATDPENGISPLMEVAARGNVSLARLLIEHGADVNWRNRRNGWGAVLEVCAKNKLECLSLLLSADAEVDCWTNPATGVTPLIEACSRGHVKCAKMLLDHGADPDARNTDNGWSAMMEACAKGQIDSVRLLIEHGADVNSVTKQPNGDSPLMTACGKGHEECAQALIDAGAKVDRGSNDGWRPVISACDNDKPRCLRLLIEKGAEVNFFTNAETGFTPLMKACSKGSPECVRLLLEANANVDAGNLKTGWRAVMNCVKDHPKARVNPCDDEDSMTGSEVDGDADDGGIGSIALSSASPNRVCDTGKLQCLKLLIDEGADVNFQTENLDGWCPLMRACREGIPECVKVLLDGEADPNLYNRANGMTVLMEACCVAGKVGAECVKTLLDCEKTNIDMTSKKLDGKTALGLACERANYEVAHELIKAGADVNLGAQRGVSPLQLTCMKGHEDIVRLLLNCGVDARQAMDMKDYRRTVPKSIQAMLSDHVVAKCGADADAAAAELLRELEQEEEKQQAKAQKRKKKKDKKKQKARVEKEKTSDSEGAKEQPSVESDETKTDTSASQQSTRTTTNTNTSTGNIADSASAGNTEKCNTTAPSSRNQQSSMPDTQTSKDSNAQTQSNGSLQQGSRSRSGSGSHSRNGVPPKDNAIDTNGVSQEHKWTSVSSKNSKTAQSRNTARNDTSSSASAGEKSSSGNQSQARGAQTNGSVTFNSTDNQHRASNRPSSGQKTDRHGRATVEKTRNSNNESVRKQAGNPQNRRNAPNGSLKNLSLNKSHQKEYQQPADISSNAWFHQDRKEVTASETRGIAQAGSESTTEQSRSNARPVATANGKSARADHSALNGQTRVGSTGTRAPPLPQTKRKDDSNDDVSVNPLVQPPPGRSMPQYMGSMFEHHQATSSSDKELSAPNNEGTENYNPFSGGISSPFMLDAGILDNSSDPPGAPPLAYSDSGASFAASIAKDTNAEWNFASGESEAGMSQETSSHKSPFELGMSMGLHTENTDFLNLAALNEETPSRSDAFDAFHGLGSSLGVDLDERGSNLSCLGLNMSNADSTAGMYRSSAEQQQQSHH